MERYINSPMEQYEIFPIIGMNISLNNVILYFLISAYLGILMYKIGTMKGKLIPTTYGIVHESQFRTINLMIETYIGKNKVIYGPMIYTLFNMILFSNLIGLIPYSSTPTVEIIMTLSLAFTILIGVLIIGFLTHKLYLLAAFLPSGTPLALIAPMIILEILAYLTRTFSLGLRLAVNMITGHILVKVCVNFIWEAYENDISIIILAMPLFLLTLFLGLEILIAYLQAYIFTFIVCITFKDMTM